MPCPAAAEKVRMWRVDFLSSSQILLVQQTEIRGQHLLYGLPKDRTTAFLIEGFSMAPLLELHYQVATATYDH